MNKKAVLPLLVVALLPLIYVVGCDSANPVAPAGTVLTVTANPTTIGLNDSSVITVTGFRPDGNPLNPGTQITLTTTMGNLATSTLSVGSGGSATTALTGDGRIGTATITASTPASESTATADVQIGETAESKPTLTISVTPSTLGLNETATVSVLARNADGSVFGSGGTIQLEATLGTLDREILTTNAEGRAETIFLSGDQVGTAEISGVIGASDQATASITIENQRPTLILNANPSTVPVLGQAEISILARDNNNNPLAANQRIQLFASLGSVPDEVRTDSSGRAEATFNAGSEPGTAVVQAVLGSSELASVNIEIRDAVREFIFTATPTTIDRPINEQTQTIRLTGVTRNAQGQAINNVLVTFVSRDVGGTFQTSTGTSSNGTVATSGNGVAEVDLVVTSQGVGTRNSFSVEATVVSEGTTFTRTVVVAVRN